MAWETLSVISGEIKSESEFRQTRAGYGWNIGEYSSDAENVYTGGNALYEIARANGVGLSLEGVPWTTFRSGYWFKTRGFWPNSSWLPFIAYSENDWSGYWSYYVTMNWERYTLQLVDYDHSTGIATQIDSTNDVTALLGNTNDWKHISLYHNRSTNSVKFWVNGEELLSGSLLSYPDMRWFYACEMGNISDLGGYPFIDDLYFDYSTSSEVDDTPPARRYYPSLPDGDGTHTDWTSTEANHYSAVNDSDVPDDDVSYVTTGVNSSVDSYDFAALGGVAPEAQAESVVVQAYARTSPVEGGIASLKFLARLGGIEDKTDLKRVRQQQNSNISGDNPTYLDWTVLTGYFDTKPTGGEWSETDFNASEFGIESDGII